MEINNERLRHLLHAYVNNRIRSDEFQELKSYVAKQGDETDLYQAVDDLWTELDVNQPLPIRSDHVFRKILNDPRILADREQRETTRKNLRIKRYWYSVAGIAASICIVFLLSPYVEFGTDEQSGEMAAQTHMEAAIHPGGQKAMLTLADGRTISLGEVGDGALAEQAGFRIVKTEDGQLFYEPITAVTGDMEAMYNTVNTPKGGEYQLALPDGTRVWLNAMSSLRYPVRFTGDERQVELTGEAYFEVSGFTTGGRRLPFIVKTVDQAVEVLGTHFNIKAYPGENATKTTLLEGKVRVSIPQKAGSNTTVANVLSPNQQATVKHGSHLISVVPVDPANAIAWKNGNFAFHNSDMVEVMNTIARWYDVDVEYEEEAVKHKRFGGTISRFESFEKLLKTIELTGTVKFKIEGRRVIVMT